MPDLSLLSALLTNTDFNAITDPTRLAQPAELPITCATYKAKPEYFIVNEQMDVDFTDEGEHLWVLIKKTGMNTGYAANLLAEWATIPARDVGYSGLKDRQAVTTQWFSLRIPNRQLPETAFEPPLKEYEQLQILEQHWHNKKLNRGTHKLNQFIITLTDIDYADKASVETRLKQISDHGVPNYFGSQRFGHGGGNIKEALAWLAPLITSDSTSLLNTNTGRQSGKNKKITKRQREQQSLYLSAARSLIFNQILDARVRDGSWEHGLEGEVFNLNGTGSIFSSTQLDEELRQRLLAKDIHPTGILWGIGSSQTTAKAALLERQIVENDPILSLLAEGLASQGVRSQRRSLRLIPQDLSWQWLNDHSLQLQFALPTGSYATSMLASLVHQLRLFTPNT